MKTEGIENLKIVLRRSRWILLVLIVLGIVQMNVVRHLQGPQYSATANVILSPTDLASSLAGLNSYVDPTLVDQTEQALADSRELFAYAARRSHGKAGSASDLESATSVSKSGTTISFTSTGSSSDSAAATANVVARAYPSWRTSISNAALTAAIDQLRRQQATSATKDPAVTTQLNRLRLLKTVTSGNVLLVEPARGGAQTRPRTVRDSLIGGFIGLFVALIVIGLREAFDTRVRSEREVEDLLGIPVLGSIERLPRNVSPLVSSRRDTERYADMYALLAASIARMREGQERTIIAVTSATAQEGKTTTAANLGSALARRNAHVRLVDFDTRRPSLARMFSIPRDAAGVDRAVSGNGSIQSLLWEVAPNGVGVSARRLALTGRSPAASHAGARLEVLPMGGLSLGSVSAHADRVDALVEEVGEDTDYVIIDTPPALSVPDVTELARVADIILVIARHGHATRRSLDAFRRLSRSWPAVDMYAVVVDTPPDGDSYSYYASN